MKKNIIYTILLCCLGMMTTACEKLDMDAYLKEIGTESGGTEITKDGVVQTEGAVDLGLSVKWAACNLDADGFTTDCSESGTAFKWSVDPLLNPPVQIGGSSFDNATDILGDSWQTPSREQWEELLDNCRVSYTIYKKSIGYIITGKTGKAIFIPMDASYTTYYWSSTSDGNEAYVYYLQNTNLSWTKTVPTTFNDCYIRPVERK